MAGRVAQWESARLTRERSLVRTQPRPSGKAVQWAPSCPSGSGADSKRRHRMEAIWKRPRDSDYPRGSTSAPTRAPAVAPLAPPASKRCTDAGLTPQREARRRRCPLAWSPWTCLGSFPPHRPPRHVDHGTGRTTRPAVRCQIVAVGRVRVLAPLPSEPYCFLLGLPYPRMARSSPGSGQPSRWRQTTRGSYSSRSAPRSPTLYAPNAR